MKDVKDIIISKYMREIQPIMDEIGEILIFSSQQFIIDEFGIRKVLYGDENQHKIDMLNRQIELIRNNYKSQHPELFKYI